MNHYIIDGNNLIGKILKKKKTVNKGTDREELARILNVHFAGKKCKVTLHFDGHENIPVLFTKGKIIYSGNRTSDEKIRLEIDNSKSKRKIILVTSDRQLAEYAKVNSCKVVSSEEFAKRINSGRGGDEEIQRIKEMENDAEEFKKLFGLK
ncbi:NYN domain-containing protein [Melioribacter sp. Ez-97]|jgi:hypothetical protein|uniref:NYN domain-containing protein n=1 Tax=Melioribacter sp. Ez-97 TaxID=3423434 RepID=UPI003ED94CA5